MPSTSGLLNAKVGTSQVKKLYLGAQVDWELWTPGKISTLFWHDAADASTITAAGNVITQVNDKSGNGYDLTVAPGFNGPLYGTRTLNGLGLIEYTGDNCLENLSFTHNHNLTPLNMAMVFSPDDTGTQRFFFAGRNQQPNPTAAGTRMVIRRISNSDQVQILGGSNTGSNINLTDGTVSGGETPIAIFKFNGANSEIRLNGSLGASGNIGTNVIGLLQFGHNENEAGDLDGYFGEIIAFTDNSKQEIVEGYLAWKWGLRANLPALHPYKNQPPLA